MFPLKMFCSDSLNNYSWFIYSPLRFYTILLIIMFNYDLPSDHPSSLTMSHQVLRNNQPGSSSATGLVGGRGIDEHRRLFQPSRLYNRRTGGKGKGPSSENPTVKKARKQNTCTYWKKNSFCLSSCDQVLKPTPQQESS